MVQRLRPEWQEPHIFKRQLFRSNVPHAKGTSTGVHYDQIFLRAGPPNTLTAWVPIGDCPPMSGGLMYLEDSKGLGEEMEEKFTTMSNGKGLSDTERLSAFNSNVCPSITSCRQSVLIGEDGGERDAVLRCRGVWRERGRWQTLVDRGLRCGRCGFPPCL